MYLVWTVWGWMLAAALLCTALYSRNVPRWDDFLLAPYVAMPELITAEWFWEQFNEHRIPLPKLLMLSQLATTRDYRTAMVFNALALALAAGILVRCASRLRGRCHWVDCVYPLLLLSWAQCDAYLWNFSLQLTLGVGLASGLLALIAGRQTWCAKAPAVCGAMGIVLLTLTGGSGLLFLPVLAVWLGGAGLWQACTRTGADRAWGLALLALGLLCGLLLAVYFRGYVRPAQQPQNNQLWNSARTGVQFVSMAFGHLAWPLWPFSAGAVLGAVGAGSSLLGVVFWKNPAERFRAAGLFAFLLALLTLAGAVGVGRGGYADYFIGFQPRYALPATLFLCWSALVGQLYLRPPWTGVVGGGHVVLAGALAVLNIPQGHELAQKSYGRAVAVEKDVEAGVPPYRIVARHTPFLSPSQEGIPEVLRMLRDAGIGVFVELADDPVFTEFPLAATPRPHLARRRSGEWQFESAASFLEFTPPAPRRVAGLRLTYSHANDAGTAPVFVLRWKPSPAGEYEDKRGRADWIQPTGEGPFQVTFWVDEHVGRFRLHVDSQPCTFRLHSTVLLLPPPHGPREPEAAESPAVR